MPPPVDSPPSNYRFVDLTLDVARRCVTREGQRVELKALDFDLLRFLVESAPNVVNADVLAEKVWGRHFVSPENVAQRVMLLRQSLSDDASKPRYIETVRNKGYRLIPVVELLPAEALRATLRPRRLVTAAAALLLAVAAGYWLVGTTERPTPLPRSVAVMPFENSGPDPAQGYFAIGMQDEIVSQLLKINGLRVFRVQPSDPEIVRRLNVEVVLGGSVNYADGRVHVSTHLARTATGESLWSDSYEREEGAIFAIQSSIALDVAQELSIELSEKERTRIERVPTTDPRARELYQVAKARQERASLKERLSAIEEVEEALALDDGYVEAWVLDSGLRASAQFLDPKKLVEHRNRAEVAANRALELDPENPVAHAALGHVLWSKKDWIRAEAAFRRAQSLNLPPSGYLSVYASLQQSVGHFDRARDLNEQARAAEPEDGSTHRFLAFSYAALGDWPTASTVYESGERLFTGEAEVFERMRNDWMHWLIARNDLAQARAIATTQPPNTAMLASLAAPNEALVELRREYAATVAGNPRLRSNIAIWAGHFGEPALALEAMRAAIGEQGGHAPFLWYPQLAQMRRLPEFKVYMREIGMVAYWDEYGWPPFCERLDQHEFECE
jgi:TolB-like protein/DNA-binding winged helix-turn-helix (wHTH) protein/Flp pilus assembly protein TadD